MFLAIKNMTSSVEHVSINLIHYSHVDDFGETSAGKNPPKRSDLLRITVDSIAQCTDYPAEFNVWDNGGKPDDSDYLLGKVREGVVNTYVRSKDNLHFAFGWNRLAKISTGKYLCFICNDVEVGKGWLSACVEILRSHEGEKMIATPFITYDKKRYSRPDAHGHRLNPRAGSNCMVLTREAWAELGEFPHHRIGGTLWYNRLKSLGYVTIAPAEDLAQDRGWRHGVNFSIPIKVVQQLLTGAEADFSAQNQ